MADEPLPSVFETGVGVIRSEVARIGDGPGVYRMLSETGDVLYVGKAKALSKRVVSYTRPLALPTRLQRMISETRSMEFITTQTEVEALLLEASLIKSLRPKYNVLLKDDKSYPYILMTDGEFPRIVKFRGRPAKDGTYFGPFADGRAVSETLAILQRAFRLRNCTDSYFAARTRPCLQYHIKRCTAPCVGRVSTRDYARQVEDARDFLNGKSRAVQERLQSEMMEASAAQDYELAAQLRDQIKFLTSIQAHQGPERSDVPVEADLIALVLREGWACVQVFFYRGGRSFGNRSFVFSVEPDLSESVILSGFMAQYYEGQSDKRIVPKEVYCSVSPKDRALLEDGFGFRIKVPQRGSRAELTGWAVKNADEALARHLMQKGNADKVLRGVADLFGLEDVPQRIEIYDNSHSGGTHMVGAMVVASPDGFEKNAYRKFNIREAGASDDYGMMREVMLRRFAKIDPEHIEEIRENWPDLLLIDGGAGQLSSVMEVLDELGISDHLSVVGIAKGEDRNAGREKFFIRGREMFQLPEHDPVLHYLQRLRDEAHRFAIGTHRKRREKAALGSRLDDVPGIGGRRKKALLLHFGSFEAIKQARVEDLAKVSGISHALAEQIYRFFRA